jgi:hypothetical protein
MQKDDPVDQATHGGGKRDAEGQSSDENRLPYARRETPGPVRKPDAKKKTVPTRPATGSRQ